jgi:aspartyl/asparaginyl-tRNA synthetase
MMAAMAARVLGQRGLHTTIKEALAKPVGEAVQVRGWVLSVRPQKRVAFVDLSDGTTVRALQVVSTDPAMTTSVTLSGVCCIAALRVLTVFLSLSLCVCVCHGVREG